MRYGQHASTRYQLFSSHGSRHFLPYGHGFTGSPRLPPQSTQRLTLPQAIAISPHTGTGILTRCPSPTLLSLGLGPTNPTRTDLPSETLDFRRIGFSPISRYSCQHSHSHTLQQTSQSAFSAYGTLPYHNFRSRFHYPCLRWYALDPLHYPRKCV